MTRKEGIVNRNIDVRRLNRQRDKGTKGRKRSSWYQRRCERTDMDEPGGWEASVSHFLLLTLLDTRGRKQRKNDSAQCSWCVCTGACALVRVLNHEYHS